MDKTTDILEKHWKRMEVKYSRTNDTLRWKKTLRSVRCAMCGEFSRERKLDQSFPEWGVLLFHFSEEGRMPEACPTCMKKISPQQIPTPRIAICAGCGVQQREKIFGLGFPGWQTIRFPAQGIKSAAIRITDLWCPNCSIKLARELGPEFVRGSWTVQTFPANSLLTSTDMTNLYTNVREAAYPHDNLLINGNFESWSAGIAVAPDGWTLIAGAVGREAGTVRIGAYSCNVNLGGANTRIRQDFTDVTFANYGARAFTFGCWVHSDEAAVALIRVSTIGGGDVATATHTGGGAWEWLTATVTLDAGATGIRVECENDNGGNDHFFDGAILVESEHVEAFTPHTTDKIPCFLAYPAVAQLNFAVGVAVDVVFATEAYDLGDNFATPSFTAPRDGIYHFDCNLRVDGMLVAGGFYQIRLVTSNRTYTATTDTSQFVGNLTNWQLAISQDADMQAGDTAKIQIFQNAGAATTDIFIDSFFSGHLAGLF